MKRAKITQTIEALPASKLIGHDVRNHEGDYLGEIEDMVIDMESGNVAYCVLWGEAVLGLRIGSDHFSGSGQDLERQVALDRW